MRAGTSVQKMSGEIVLRRTLFDCLASIRPGDIVFERERECIKCGRLFDTVGAGFIATHESILA
jgi:hypothetical protein